MSHKLITTALILYAPVTQAWFVPEESTAPTELEQAWVIKAPEMSLNSPPATTSDLMAPVAGLPVPEKPTPSQQAAAVATQTPTLQTISTAEHTPPKIESAVKAVLDWHGDFFDTQSATLTESLFETSEFTPPDKDRPIIPDLLTRAEPEPVHKLNKRSIPLTKEELANEKYTQAIEALKSRNFAFAEHILGMILKETPTHTLSRVQLAKLFVVKNEYIQAEGVLTPIKSFYLKNPEYIQTLALVYEHNGKKRDALSLLSQMPTQYRNTPEYYSLSASLYQQTGNYLMAKRYYQSLLRGDPSNARWMLGFSITLDSNGETESAKTWYGKILQTGNLDPNISMFVKNRLIVLGTTRKK